MPRCPRSRRGQTVYFAAGRDAEKVGECTMFLAGRRVFTVLARADAKDGDPEGMKAVQDTLTSLKLVEPAP